MTYQLKTTGIAAHCTMCITVDPGDGVVKDFASSAVTSTISVGASVTFGEQAWAGIPRKYFKMAATTLAAGTVTFGANKPQFDPFAATLQRTIVWIGESAGNAPRAFGASASSYIAAENTGGGAGSSISFL
ncbi:MAG: hypothetical protein FWC58_03795 [Desulfobulbus sp.]|nr:hypothetical protein [Desulfobulbus sp.]